MHLPEVGDRVWAIRPDGRLVRPYRLTVVDRRGGEQPDGTWRLVTYLLGGLRCSYPWYSLSRERPKERR